MKNFFLLLITLLAIKSYSQADVIILIDNSGSITNEEYTAMSTSIKGIIENILECNEGSKVAVVHYAGSSFGLSKIWIESDFTNNLTLATSFVRRSTSIGYSDYAHDAIALIGNALDHIPNARILSPQTTINHSTSNNLVVYLFTDSWRNFSTSYLVDSASTGIGTNAAFANYTNFKNNRYAKFVVTIVSPDAAATRAGAAIASGGGSYTGLVESYPNDPDGPGVSGRYLTETGFNLTAIQLETVSNFICTLSGRCVTDLILTSPTNDIAAGTDFRISNKTIMASNTISGTADVHYWATDMIQFSEGFYSANTAKLHAVIKTCEEMGYMRPGNDKREITANNSKTQNRGLHLFPNPAKEKVSIESDEAIRSVMITSFDGRIMYHNNYPTDSILLEVELQNYKPGIYIINLLTISGKTHTEKLVVQ